MIALGIAHTAADILLWGLLVWFGFWLNRRLKLGLHSLRWAAVYLVASAFLGFVTPFIVKPVIDSGPVPFGWTHGMFVASWSYVNGIARSLGLLILALMIVAELAPIAARAASVPELKAADPLSNVRDRIGLLGIALLAIAFIPFVLAAAARVL